MKFTELIVSSLWSLSIANLSSKGLSINSPANSIIRGFSQGEEPTFALSVAHTQTPLVPSLGQGPELRFNVDSAPRPARDKNCPQPPVLSCSPQAAVTDSCCVVSPGGILVHAQFWDRDIGHPDSWGIHGLWPDKCNGEFYENCDGSRAYMGEEIIQALQDAGAQDTLDFMYSFWLSNDESPSEFWAHEWKTHGTCVSTLEPRCFSNYQLAKEVAPYFETVVNLFGMLDTYRALAIADIRPSSTATYTLASLQSAVRQHTGYTPDFICSGSTLSSVQYYLRVQGPLQGGRFIQSNPSRSSNCPHTGIKYPVKTVPQTDLRRQASHEHLSTYSHHHDYHGHH